MRAGNFFSIPHIISPQTTLNSLKKDVSGFYQHKLITLYLIKCNCSKILSGTPAVIYSALMYHSQKLGFMKKHIPAHSSEDLKL